MNDYTTRAIEAFLTKTLEPTIGFLLSKRSESTRAQIENDLAKEYSEIADKMAGKETPCPTCSDPDLAAEIVKTAFEEAKKELEAGRTPDKKKLKARVIKKLKAKD